jgi:ribosome biogenesis GTPase A
MSKVVTEWSKLGKFSWFPGHMYKATNELKEKLSSIDVFIEIRDARLPYTSLNEDVDDMIKSSQKKKIVLFNKYDLCNSRVTLQAIQNLNKMGVQGFAASAI